MSSIVQLNTKPQAKPITVAYGDGIGPEIMEAVLKILVGADFFVHWYGKEIAELVGNVRQLMRFHSLSFQPQNQEVLRGKNAAFGPRGLGRGSSAPSCAARARAVSGWRRPRARAKSQRRAIESPGSRGVWLVTDVCCV